MKISKHIHSCLFVEDQGKTFLIDPGKHTYREKAFPLDRISHLDYILLTHEHGDHMSIPFLKEILTKFPKSQIYSNNSVKAILAKEGMIVFVEKNEHIDTEVMLHESSFDRGTPLNTVFTLNQKLLHPGDTIQYNKKAEIMCLPVDCGFWGKVSHAVEKLVSLHPKYILPIHDYRLKDEFRKKRYERLEEYFGQFGITFIKMETGEEKIV